MGTYYVDPDKKKCPGRPFAKTDEELEELGFKLIEWMKEDGNFWYKKFFILENVPYTMAFRYAERSQTFKQCLEMAKNIQEDKIFSGSLTKVYDSRTATFCLAARHGWTNRVETVHSGDPRNPLGFILDSPDSADLTKRNQSTEVKCVKYSHSDEDDVDSDSEMC